jgi:hypothetical protein
MYIHHRPKASFVAKTYKMDKDDKDKKGDKVFINIVSSEFIMGPSKTTSPEGDSWSLPYSLGMLSMIYSFLELCGYIYCLPIYIPLVCYVHMYMIIIIITRLPYTYTNAYAYLYDTYL